VKAGYFFFLPFLLFCNEERGMSQTGNYYVVETLSSCGHNLRVPFEITRRPLEGGHRLLAQHTMLAPAHWDI
jgi:hypothetical protein